MANDSDTRENGQPKRGRGRPPKPYPLDTLEQTRRLQDLIPTLLAGKVTDDQVCELLLVTKSALRTALKRLGVPRRRRNRQEREALRDEVYAEYIKPTRLKDLAKKYKLSIPDIATLISDKRKLLRRQGLLEE